MTIRATDTRLLDVAIDHFGRHGLTGASTRAIARDAGTPMSSITYHFGGKNGLYLAAARHIGVGMAERLGPAVTEADRVCGDSEATPTVAREALLRIYAHMVKVLVGEDTASLARFIVREQAAPSAAFALIYETMMAPLLTRIARLLDRVAGGGLGDREARVRAIALTGQVLVFRVSRETVLRGIGWTEVGADELVIIQDVVADHLRAVLDRIAGTG